MQIFEAAALVFWSAQGGVVFAGAYAAVKLSGRVRALDKVRAMAVSYLAWMALTALVFGRLGGGAPLVTGSGPLLVALFLTAFASAAAWLLLWLLWPASCAELGRRA